MANEYLKRQPTSSGNNRRWTVAFWMKNSNPTQGYTALMGAGKLSPNNIYNELWYSASELGLNLDDAGDPGNYNIIANPLLRDPNSWMHVVVSFTDQGDNANTRIRFYINGAAVDNNTSTSFETTEFSFWNHSDYIHYIGSRVQQSAGTVTFDAQYFDIFMVDGQALTPDVFGFNKDGAGYISAGVAWENSQTKAFSTDFRPGQWSPHLPRKIKTEIERRGGFGANGYYLPMNDSSNPGADFHCTPNSIIKLKGEDLPQPRNGAPTTSDAYVSQLREEKGSEDLPFEGVVRFGGDGTLSSLKFPDDNDLDLGGSPFTAECWIYPQDTSGANYGALFNKGFGFQVYWKDDIEALQLFVSGDGSNYNVINGVTSQNGSVPKGKWCHIAVVREPGNNTWKMFTNGKLTYGPLVVSGSVHDNGNPWALGDYAPSAGSYEFKGFISNFRLVVGNALYTAPFTPPTTRLENIANTKLLCCQSATSATEAAVSPTTGGTAGGANTFATKNELTGSISLAVPGISTATGANLVTNGHFDTDTSGWSSFSSATLTQVDGTLKVECTGGDTVSAGSYNFTTVVGQRYTVSVEVVSQSGTCQMGISDTNIVGAGATIMSSTSTAGVIGLGLNTRSFTATATTTYIGLWTIDADSNARFDNVVVKQEDAPRDYSADIRGSGSNLTLTPSGNAGVGYELDGYYGSAMTFAAKDADEFNVDGSSSNEDLQLRTGDFTIEAWVYPRVWNSGNMDWIGKNGGQSNSSDFEYGVLSDGRVVFYHGDGTSYQNSGTLGLTIAADQVACPTGQWTHIVGERHGNKFTAYINGVAKGTIDNCTINMPGGADLCIGNDSATATNSWHWDGQIQDLRIYKGIAKYKRAFDVPKPYGPVGIKSWRVTPDTSKNNFATLNPHFYQTTGTYATHTPGLSNGNLTFSKAANGHWERSHCSFGASEGKWYYEFMAVDRPKPDGAVGENWAVGVRESDSDDFYKETDGFEDIGDHVYWADAGTTKIVSNQDRNAAGVVTSGITAAADGDIINVAFEKTATTLKVWFGLNGTYFNSGNPSSGTNPAVDVASTDRFIIPAAAVYCYAVQNEPVFAFNFGQDPSFSGRTTAGTDSDSSGKGLFKYLPPSGFVSLCSDNLPTPTIPDPGKHFRALLYQGNTDQVRPVVGAGFAPDFVWQKDRVAANWHRLTDSVRGNYTLYSNATTVEALAESNGHICSLDSDGFTADRGSGPGDATNGSGKYVGWCWKAGGPAVPNTKGNITSQVSVNQTAGFSIVSYTGNGGATGTTVGHGLSKAPSFIIMKNRDATFGWPIYHKSQSNIGNSAADVVYLNSTAPGNSDNIRDVNDDTMGLLNWGGTNGNGNKIIAYCWTEIEGYSRFGSYLGNSNSDGAFVYCGFRPAWVLIKNIDASGEWCIWDSSRSPYNEMQDALRPNDNAIETDGFQFDFYSNGFKARDTESSVNLEGDKYIYAAFAESPFQTANAK